MATTSLPMAVARGADILRGRLGNDHYIVRNAATTIVEVAGQGTDRVSAGLSFTLAADDDIETFTTTSSTGVGAINLTGNGVTQTITGNDGANRIDSGLGNDVVTGRGGADVFVFTTAPGAGNVDEITDYTILDDQIEVDDGVFAGLALGVMTATTFVANTTGQATTAAQRIIYETDTGFLWYDADGTGGTVREQFANLTPSLAMLATEITVV